MGTGLNAMTPARISISSISYGFHNAVNNVHTYGLICIYRAVCDSACDTPRTCAWYNPGTGRLHKSADCTLLLHIVTCCRDGGQSSKYQNAMHDAADSSRLAS